MPAKTNERNENPFVISGGTKHVILCEGKDDEDFLNFYINSDGFSQYDTSTIQVTQLGGKVSLRKKMAALSKVPGFDQIQSLLVIRDADNDVEGARKSVKGAFQAIDFPIPQSEHKWEYRDSIKTGFLLMPSCSEESQTGALEDLCWSIMTNKHGESICKEVVDFIESLKQSGKRTYTHLNKAYIHTYFSATEGLISFNIGRAARAGAFDWSSPELDPLHSFLVSMVNTDS